MLGLPFVFSSFLLLFLRRNLEVGETPETVLESTDEGVEAELQDPVASDSGVYEFSDGGWFFFIW